MRALRATREQVAALISEHRGRLADFTGDNFLAEARNAALPEPRRMRFRIGAPSATCVLRTAACSATA